MSPGKNDITLPRSHSQLSFGQQGEDGFLSKQICILLKLTRAGFSLAALCLSSFALTVFASSLRNRRVAMADACD